MRLIDADALKVYVSSLSTHPLNEWDTWGVLAAIDKQPTITAPRWHRVEEELPKEPGEYIVAYHPCYWDDVQTKVTKVGIDNFRGKSAWAKKKFQRVTHWMDKPEPLEEETK